MSSISSSAARKSSAISWAMTGLWAGRRVFQALIASLKTARKAGSSMASRRVCSCAAFSFAIRSIGEGSVELRGARAVLSQARNNAAGDPDAERLPLAQEHVATGEISRAPKTSHNGLRADASRAESTQGVRMLQGGLPGRHVRRQDRCGGFHKRMGAVIERHGRPVARVLLLDEVALDVSDGFVGCNQFALLPTESPATWPRARIRPSSDSPGRGLPGSAAPAHLKIAEFF